MSLGNAPLQRQHFELYLCEQLAQRRAASRGKAPLQLQHRFCATLFPTESFALLHVGRKTAADTSMLTAAPMNK